MIQVAEITGFAELQRKLEKLGDARTGRRLMLPVLRQVAEPTVKAARSLAPKSQAPHHRYSNGKIIATYQPGNLSKSIGKIVGRDKNNAVLYVGPRAGKNRKYDGFYGNFVEAGTVHMPAQPFMGPAYAQTKGMVTKNAEQKVARKIQQQINKLSKS